MSLELGEVGITESVGWRSAENDDEAGLWLFKAVRHKRLFTVKSFPNPLNGASKAHRDPQIQPGTTRTASEQSERPILRFCGLESNALSATTRDLIFKLGKGPAGESIACHQHAPGCDQLAERCASGFDYGR
jgi:hypothetical protein